jgi:hypothetical protein
LVTILDVRFTTNTMMNVDVMTTSAAIDFEAFSDDGSWASSCFPWPRVQAVCFWNYFQLHQPMKFCDAVDIDDGYSHLHYASINNRCFILKIQRIHSFQPICPSSWRIWNPFLMNVGVISEIHCFFPNMEQGQAYVVHHTDLSLPLSRPDLKFHPGTQELLWWFSNCDECACLYSLLFSQVDWLSICVAIHAAGKSLQAILLLPPLSSSIRGSLLTLR